jgi:putative SOS response-associated peptidase YedK
MCGRLVIDIAPEIITEIFGVSRRVNQSLTHRYNVAPTQDIPIVRQANDEDRELSFARWGLIPSWAKDISIGNSLINARSETVSEKPSFRAAFKHRRCIIPAGGFYEWQRQEGKRKQPWLFRMAGGGPMSLAGLWEHWQSLDGQILESCTILTTSANNLMLPIHDRMPVILAGQQEVNAWLNLGTSQDILQELLHPCAETILASYQVSEYVNKTSHTGTECIAPVNI